jgi:hypothetical protein
MDWKIYEAGTTFLDRLPLEELPTSLPLQVKILRKNNSIGFEVGNVVGAIPMKNGDSLRISPKYEGINIVDMMLYVQGVDNKLRDKETGRQYSTGDGIANIFYFVNSLVKQIEIIEEKSLKFERVQQPSDSSYVKGRVNWVNTMINRKRKKQEPIKTKVYVSQYDIPENILLSAASKKALSFVERNSKEWHVLHRWAQMFSDKNTLKSLRQIDRKLLQDRISGARAYYTDAIVTAKIILGYYGVDLGEEIEGDAFLVNTPDLYEQYVRVGCEKVLKPRGIFVSKGFFPTEFMFEDGSCELIPDLVFWKSNSVILVGDVKYKEPDNNDFYQMFTYMKRSSVNRGVMFTPCKHNEKEPIINSKRAYDGSIVYIVSIPNTGSITLEETLESLWGKKLLSI